MAQSSTQRSYDDWPEGMEITRQGWRLSLDLQRKVGWYCHSAHGVTSADKDCCYHLSEKTLPIGPGLRKPRMGPRI